ncbi:MFS siderochrome iron transporter 1 [Exophiala dermatitidis]
MTILGVGLMIHFRQPDVNIGYIVMTQIFIAFGGGTLVICEQMTVMAVSRHGNIPAVLAVEAMVCAMGSSVGSTIAAAMWTGIFPKKLMKNLPDSAKGDFASIYGDLTVQSSYPPGSPTRIAIDKLYGQTQKLMLITATCLYSITLSSTFFWQDVDVKNIKQRTKVLI